MNNSYPFVRPSEDGEVQEAEHTNEQLCKILEEMDGSATPFADGNIWVCPFCSRAAGLPYYIHHADDCIMLMARQVMRDADMETSMDRYEKELERGREL